MAEKNTMVIRMRGDYTACLSGGPGGDWVVEVNSTCFYTCTAAERIVDVLEECIEDGGVTTYATCVPGSVKNAEAEYLAEFQSEHGCNPGVEDWKEFWDARRNDDQTGRN